MQARARPAGSEVLPEGRIERPGDASVAVSLALLLGLQALSTDLYIPALPMLARSLHAPAAAVQATMAALLFGFGIGQLVWGPVSDRVGRRPVLLAGLALYAAAALGAALAGDVGRVVAWRAVQGLGLATAVVCARAILRDLYAPQDGARVMSHALSGLGLMAIVAPIAGGLLAGAWGWRSAFHALAACGAALWLYIAWRVPESLARRNPRATALRPMLGQMRRTLAHPTFRAYALLVCASYGALFVFLASSGFVMIGVLGLSPAACGMAVATSSLAYIAGTMLCRRLLPRFGLRGAVLRASVLSLAACALMSAIAWADLRSLPAFLAAQWVFALGHGVHQPCGQAGAVGPFPHAAGTASALAGFMLAATAVGISTWLGNALDGTMRPLAGGVALGTALTCVVAWTLVRRHGDAR